MIPHRAGSCPAQFREGCLSALSKTIRSQGIKVQTLQNISYFDICPVSKVPVIWVIFGIGFWSNNINYIGVALAMYRYYRTVSLLTEI